MNILIVEDDRTNQDLLGFQAEEVGYDVNVVTADNGEEALLRVIQSAPIALILLDLGLPRLDGFEFLARLRSKPLHQHIPVIVVSARDLSIDDDLRLKQLGVRHFFQKGRYDTQALTDAISANVR